MHEWIFFLVPALAFAVTVGCGRLLPAFAWRVGLLDHPDGIRKRHERPVPLVGGLAVVAGVATVSFLEPARLGWSFVGGACVPLVLSGFLLIGLWDDLHEPPAGVRFLLEGLLVIAVLSTGGFAIRDLGSIAGPFPFELGPASLPFTFLALLGFVNAVNFLDGLDALAAGVGWVSWLWLAVLAFVGGFGPLAVVALAWLGALLAYLPFNLGLHPRLLPKIFLGDSGSLLLGAALALFALTLHRVFVGMPLSPPAMVYAWILGYPVLDALAVIARRVLRGRNPMRPDRSHLHHLLLARGLSRRRVAFLLTFVAFSYGLVGILGWYVLGLNDEALVLLFLLAAASQTVLALRLGRGAGLEVTPGAEGG